MEASLLATVTVAVLLLTGLLTGCDVGPGDTASSPSESASPPASENPKPTPTAMPISIPDDCRAILSDDVLAQLVGVPLNDPAVGGGVQGDGSLLCIWRDPRTDTTSLVTEISHMPRGLDFEMLNDLVEDDDFTCFTPDEGTRCEKTWRTRHTQSPTDAPCSGVMTC